MATIRGDNPKPWAPDPADWAKRLCCGTDPVELLHVHIRAARSPGWRYALVFRDFLRAEPAVAAEYATLKAELAAEAASIGDYAAAKEPWFDAVSPRIDAWAEATGWRPPD